MLRPARERLGVATQRAWTDYMAQQHRTRQRRARPHLELYTVGLLPAMLHWGVSICTTSLPWTCYPIRRLDDDRIWFGFAKSRPETLATQSAHYRRVLGTDVIVTNSHLLFTSQSAYRLLAERYPAAFTQIVTCVGAAVGERWCYRCHKCADYVMNGLALGIVDPRFDYDRTFTTSRYFRAAVAYVESGTERSLHGNAPWQPFFSRAENFLGDCHAIARASPGLIADRVGAEAFANLLMLKAAYGNRTFPSYECVPAKAVELLGHDAARRIAAIAAEHLAVVDPLPGPFLRGNTPVEYDFGVVMPTKTGLLDHIRS